MGPLASLAHVRLAQEDHAGYRAACAALVKDFGATDDADVANTVAWTCALAPDALTDLEPARQLAERAVAKKTDQESRNYLLNTLGAVLVRQKKYTDAEARLEEARKAEASGDTPLDWLFLALARAGQGRLDAAKDALARGRKQLKGGDALGWEARLELRLVEAEAARAVGEAGK
jgi:Tfp pilus assembly protein PilF